MTITPTVATLVVDTKALDATIQAWITGLTINHVYGFTVIPISDTTARLVIIYD